MHLLEQIRVKENINKTEMARRLGVAKSYYSMIINGQQSISKNMAIKIHETFGVPYEVLLSPEVQQNRTAATGTDS